ncbi:hypothetical protein P8452_10204 [Trifolium repens]|nr:hypothetical protein P8452_10204 [Trifolium repens]
MMEFKVQFFTAKDRLTQEMVHWAFLWMDQCIQQEVYLKTKCEDDECVEKKRKMKMFDLVVKEMKLD